MRWSRWLALLLVVLIGHSVVLFALHNAAAAMGGIKAMEEPLFTRMLTPAAPPRLAPSLPVAPPTPPPPPPGLFAKEFSPLVADSVGFDATETIAWLKPEPVVDLPPLTVVTATSSLAQLAGLAMETFGVKSSVTVAVQAGLTATVSTTNYGSGTATIESWPVDTKLNYKVTGNFRGPIDGKASVTWLRTGEKYQVLLNVDLGLVGVRMTSQGRVKPASLWPEIYEEKGLKPRRLRLDEEALAFEDGSTLKRPVGVQDTVSQFVELTQRFATGRAILEEGSVVHIPLARPGGVNDWYYDVSAEPQLPTRLGGNYKEMMAWHLTPRPVTNARGPITMEFWLVPELQYFPGRVRITIDKETYLELDVDTILQR